MNILLVFATSVEARIVDKIRGNDAAAQQFNFNSHTIDAMVTGIGGIATSWSLQKWLSEHTAPDLAINAGIAGSFNPDYRFGDIVMPLSDCFADLGREQGGSFQTVFEAGFVGGDEFPFKNGVIYSDNNYIPNIPTSIKRVRGITVNSASGTISTIDKLREKFNPDIETMEGATFFYICARENIPFIAIRAISNMVEPREGSVWMIPLALENLAEKVKEVLNTL